MHSRWLAYFFTQGFRQWLRRNCFPKHEVRLPLRREALVFRLPSAWGWGKGEMFRLMVIPEKRQADAPF